MMKSLFRLLMASVLLSTLVGSQANAALVQVDSYELNDSQTLTVTLSKGSSVWLKATVLDGVFASIFSQSASVGSVLFTLPGRSTTAGSLFTFFKSGSFSVTPTSGATASISLVGLTGRYSTNLTTLSAVPEPETYALLALGIAGLVLRRRRQDQQASLTAAA
jgi:hypothetical protein